MTESDNMSFYGQEELYWQREHLPFISVLVGLLIVASATIANWDIWNNIARGLGVLLAYAYLIRSMRTRLRPSAEIILYIIWVVWSMFALLSGEVFTPLFWRMWLRLFQLWILIAIISGFTESKRTLSFNFAAFLVGALIVGGYSYFTGEYQHAEAEGERVAGMALNANSFAWILLLATVCMAHFFMLCKGRKLLMMLLLLGMVTAAIGVAFSGSRIGTIGLGLFYPLWIWFCYRRQLFKRPATLLVVILVLFVGSYLFVSFAAGRQIGERFVATWKVLRGQGDLGKGGGIRIALYMQAGEVFLDNWPVGVGLDNFRLYSATFHVAHSEYAEVACDTGLPGFLLYFSIFVILWRRSGKIIMYSEDQKEVHIAGLVRAILVLVFFTNVFRYNYDHKDTWIILASCIGYTHVVWQRIKMQMSLGVSSYAYATEAVPGGQETYLA